MEIREFRNILFIPVPVYILIAISLRAFTDLVWLSSIFSLEFHFYSGSGGHSVVSSTFATPCIPGEDAFFSGYIPGSSTGDMTFVVEVNSTDPIVSCVASAFSF